jgi:DNA replication and repair protein RecF
LKIKELKLTNFKNYSSVHLKFNDFINCFVGMNGVGKTNLLDAIHFLALCKSHTNSQDSEIILKEELFFRIEAIFEENKEIKIVSKLEKGKKKIFECDDNPYTKLSKHVGLIPLVIISPEDVRLAQDGSEERRKLMDNAISQYDPTYLQQLIDYNKIISQRNALLKNGQDSGRLDSELIQVYNNQLLSPAQYIHAARVKMIDELQPYFNKVYQKLSGDKELTDIIYTSQLTNSNYAELLSSSIQKDMILGRTNQGIHKDDIVFEIENSPLKRFASQGQMKSFIIAWKIAQYLLLANYKNIKPILLLDDIFDKLDNERLHNLLDLLVELDFGQVFLTDTGKSRIEELLSVLNLEYSIYHILSTSNIQISTNEEK